ncbi:hypothetical protein MA16_Dca015554 [Dendrobium catenatum]|uniref:Uncharacterized protein n=1 Tax=Dendrobium catenatum TaxID=906689 RepID=A0A2I0WKP3_9ASPA|nr:hypothetical protein MA16_Dca015554 [Dendrobium catenatum]
MFVWPEGPWSAGDRSQKDRYLLMEVGRTIVGDKGLKNCSRQEIVVGRRP